jgi:hypothetical protein
LRIARDCNYQRILFEFNQVTRDSRYTRLTVEELATDCIDVRDLSRIGALEGGFVTIRAGMRWPAIRKIRAARYLVQIELCDRTVPQQIRVSWTQCHLGGWRPWMHCPYCEKRVVKLLKGMGGYCCRACIGNPLYACQAKSAHGRRHFEICKIRLQLNGNASLLEPFPERPRGMHRKTYERKKARALNLEMDLSPKLRGKAVDYKNLVYYLP